MQRWEYQIVTTKGDYVGSPEKGLLNRLGSEGWELVSVVGVFEPMWVEPGLETSAKAAVLRTREKFIYFFKRPIEAKKEGK